MDVVNKPPHYQGEVEAIDSIKSSMSYEAFKGYLQGNALKYVIRFDRKNGVEDLEKALGEPTEFDVIQPEIE